MHGLRALLLSSASAALIAATAGTAAAQSVEWTDDGQRHHHAEPGIRFGADRGPGRGPGRAVRPRREALRGRRDHGSDPRFRPQGRHLRADLRLPADLRGADRRARSIIALVPISELYTKIFLDLRNGTGEYDGMIVGAFMYGDLIDGNYVLPGRRLARERRFPGLVLRRDAGRLANDLHHWDGRRLRRAQRRRWPGALLPAQRPADRSRAPGGVRGRVRLRHAGAAGDLQQLKDIAAYFNGKNFDDNDAEPGQRRRSPPQGARAGPLPLP